MKTKSCLAESIETKEMKEDHLDLDKRDPDQEREEEVYISFNSLGHSPP